MKLKINLEKIKYFSKQNGTILFFIILLAYILRILPYLLGYSIPYTEDSLRDFQQVKYIIDNNKIDFLKSYQDYGAFPLLHLIVAAVSRLGFDPMKVFLFFPQILATMGIIFFYLFLKKYFSARQSLLACFLIAVFIPHIQWTAQPVRETLGLSFFPLIIYLFDKLITESHHNLKYLPVLLISLILIIPTHHWSAIMIITWMIAFSFLFAKNIKHFFYSLMLIIIFAFLNLIYWYYLFPKSFILIKNLIAYLNFTQFISILLLIVIIIIFKKFDLNKFKNKDNRRNALLITIIFLWLVTNNILPLKYPVQIWLDLMLFLIFIFVGFFYTKNNILNKLLTITIFYLFFILTALTFNNFQNVNLDSFSFDPFRTFEFAIFPLSIIAAFGLLKISNKAKYLRLMMIFTLIGLATFTYPPIFIYGHTFINTPFYDIRSNIRYISTGEKELIKWANDRGYNVISNRPEIRSYQATFYPVYNERKRLITLSDNILKEKYSYIHDPILMVDLYENSDIIDNRKIIYKNNDGFVADLQYDSVFVSYQIPEKLIIGTKINFTVEMVNSGDVTWWQDDDFSMKTKDKRISLDLQQKKVLPNGLATFSKEILIPNIPGNFHFLLMTYKKDIGFFGRTSPIIKISIVEQ